MNRRAFLAALLAACGRAEPKPIEATPAAQATAAASATTAAPVAASATATATAAAIDGFATALPVSGKAIGHTSVVFKLTLVGGLVAAFKPKSKRGPQRYKGEIAAHRLAVALDLRNVPRAIPRAFPSGALRAALTASGASALFDAEVVAEGGLVRGALLPWLDQLELVPLEGEPWRSRWAGWLKDGVVPDDQRAFAADIATMLVFDYVTGNFDRWSGGNIGRDKATGRLLFIDNDGAFYETPHPAALARQLELVRSAQRFSKSFVKSLGALDAPALRAALGDEAPGQPLLSERVLAGVDARRAIALEELAKKTLAFD